MILFLNAPGVEFHQRSSRWGGRINRSGYLVLPIFLATAANYLKKQGIDSRIVDAAASGMRREDIDDLLRKHDPEIIVIEASTISINEDAETARYLKDRCAARIVLVGFHVSALPERSMRELPADFICLGEYEKTLLEFYRAWKNHGDYRRVKGLGWRDEGGNIRINDRRPLIDLDELPMPLYDDLPLKNYYDPIARNRPCISVRTMRGCPFRCIYCVAPQVMYERKVRFRKAEFVAEEVEYLISRGVREIFFDDETFTVNRQHVYSICRSLKERGIRIDWSCFARGDCVDEEMLEEMESAGCYMIRYGIESFDDRVLRSLKKGITTDQIRRAFRLTRRLGLKTHATVMYGAPEETMETMRNTLKFVLEADPDYAQFTICTPYPGTEYYDWALKENRLLSGNWSDFDGSSRMIVKSDHLTPGLVENYVDHSYRVFYFRFRYVLKRLLRIRRWGEVYYVFKSGYNLIKRHAGLALAGIRKN